MAVAKKKKPAAKKVTKKKPAAKKTAKKETEEPVPANSLKDSKPDSPDRLEKEESNAAIAETKPGVTPLSSSSYITVVWSPDQPDPR